MALKVYIQKTQDSFWAEIEVPGPFLGMIQTRPYASKHGLKVAVRRWASAHSFKCCWKECKQ